jgi:hypothetical protein
VIIRSLFTLLSCALILLVLSPAQDHAQGLDARAMRDAIHRYISPDTTPERRESLLRLLMLTPQDDMVATLRRRVRRQDERPHCIDLARRLHLRGAFSLFERYLEESPEDIAALGLITNDRGAAASLFRAWSNADMESDLFEALELAFLTYGIDYSVMESFKAVALDADADVERQVAAMAILRFQLSMNISDPEELDLRWDDLTRRMRVDGERYDATGLNLLAMGTDSSGRADRLGPNWLLHSNTTLRMANDMPEYLTEGGYIVTIWIKPADEDTKLIVGTVEDRPTGRTQIGINFHEGRWYQARRDGRDDTAPGRARVWTKIEWEVTTEQVSSASGEKGYRMLIRINDRPFGSNAMQSNPFVGVSCYVESGEAVIGGLQYVRTR